MKLLTLSVPGYGAVQAPDTIPTGGGITFGQIIGWGVDVVIGIGVIVALGYLLYGGIMWIGSGGDKQKVDKARKILMYAIIGLMIMTFAFFVVGLVGNILGIKYF